MASLLDVANVPRTVPVNGTDVTVTGISGRGVASLMARFPEIAKLFSGITPDKKSLLNMAPDALAAFIAAGTGHPGDEKVEGIAADLGVGVQVDLIDEILLLTFPRGVGPFVAKLQALGMLVTIEAAALPGGALVQTSPLPSKS